MALVVIMLMPRLSHAKTYTDDFNDTITNSALWTASGNYYTPQNTGGVGPFTFAEYDGTLNFASNDSGLAYGGRKKYDSVWTVDFNNDFKFSVQYNTLSSADQNGSIEIGLHDAVTNKFELWSGAYNDGTTNVFDARIDEITNPVNVLRSNSGVIGISYTKANDKLEFIGGDGTNNAVYANIDNFTSTYGSFEGFQNLHVYLEGDSDKAIFNANFDNFNFQSTVTPEPVSSALFILGGAVLALKRKKVKA
jgi:hypothetical protein